MRPIRPRVIVAALLLAGFAGVTAVVWHQGDFLRGSAANYLRERLAAEFGAQFQTTELRGRWFPPGISLGHVTFERGGEPWVLTVEDLRISFNPYAILFGRERLGRVVVDRPRLFVRFAAGTGAGPSSPPAARAAPLPPGAGAAVTEPAAVGRLRAFLRPPFPLRVLKVVNGRIDVVDDAGARTVIDGIALSVLVSRGAARALFEADTLEVQRAGRRWELGGLDADFTLEEGRAVVREFAVAGGPVTGRLRGTVAYAGGLALGGELSARLENVAALAGRPGIVAGNAQVAVEVTGSWRDPAASGSISVRNPVVVGRRLPPASGQVGWRRGRLAWSGLQLPVGTGGVSIDGEADFSGGTPRYRVVAEARDLDPVRLALFPAGVAGRIDGLAGKLHWEGSGVGREAVGSGGLGARFAIRSWPGEPVTFEVDAALGGGILSVGSFRVATRALEAGGSGSWDPDSGYEGSVSGTFRDVARLVPPADFGIGGSGSFEGQLVVDAGGPRFNGRVRVAGGSLGPVGGIDAGARIAVAAGSVRLDDGALAWPGGHGSVNGTIEIASRRLDLEAVLTRLPLADAARLLGADPQPFGGTLEARLLVRGTAGAPEIVGEIAAEGLRYRAVTLDAAALSLTYAGSRLGISQLGLRRGTTQLSFRGELRQGEVIDGTFESQAFDLADFAAVPGVELAGSLRGRVRGRLDGPQAEGTVRAARLRVAGFDFKGGEAAVDYRGGTAAVKGWIGARENRLRAVLEPGRDWRFESDLELAQFAPEMVRSGLGALPPGLARVLGRASFLAAGRLQARGRLRDTASVRADLRLDSLWLQASGQSLQNIAPVHISWRDGGLVVEDFRIAGEQYHLDVRGSGSPAAGWDLRASGAVNLSVFGEYWPEIEDVDGLGDLRLTLAGPWSAPQPEGTLVVREGFVRVRSLPEALERLEGRLELQGGILTASGLTGTLGGGLFRGGGSYRFADDFLDARVEGRLDLALFRGRLPVARELRGPLDVRLRLLGALAAPVFSGEVEVLDAEMFLKPFPAKITQLRGKVVVGAERLEVRELLGRTGGGTVRLNGTLDWARMPVRVDADLVGRGIQLSLAGALKLQGDLRLGLHGDFQDLKLGGEVRVLKARYLREFSERLPKFEPAPAVAGPSTGGPNLSRMALDVKVVAADNVWIANRMAKIEAAVALAIGGRLGSPVVSGEITGIQGEAYYLARKFRLESGSLRFVPPATVPVLDLQASTSVGETQILFLMDGPLGKLTYHLTSLPALSQQDLVALLTIGETRSDLERLGDRASTAGAAAFTAEPLVNAIGDEVRSAMGLEVLQIEPVIGENQEVSARVTLGTHLSDRLFVSYSQTLGATEDQQVAVQYSLLDYLSVWGQELRQGVYSLDLVFRYALK